MVNQNRKHGFQRICSVLLALLFLVTAAGANLPALANAEESGGVTIKLHYHRPDDTYDGWDVWFWEFGKDGAGYPFAEENGEMTAVFEAAPGVEKVGFIVRKAADWTKDVSQDQFIEIPAGFVGTVDIRVESGVPGYEQELQQQGIVLKLHYHRPDETYDGWDVWMWADGMDGAGHPFAEEDGEMVATVELEPGITQVGFIVRTADWTKDVDADQFIDIPGIIAGTVHAYVESGEPGYTEKLGADAVAGVRLASARYDADAGTVIAALTGALTEDPAQAFRILDGTGAEIAVAAAEARDEKTYALTPAQALEADGDYCLVFAGSEQAVKMPNVYSTAAFEDAYTYAGNDLGATWTQEKTSFRVWAPTAESVNVNLYASGTAGTDDLIESIPMTADANGTWIAEKDGDLNGVYYTYTAVVKGEAHETIDPYARTAGVNGKRGMVLDLASTDPEGWAEDKNPNADLSYNDAIIYELHVRDLSADESAGITNVGKFLGLTETGTKTAGGIATGLDHIRELGVTHVHLLPVYDFGSVDESKLDEPQFNWGYDPVNYNLPEGSYATDPYNGEVRVKEMKQMVKALHDSGLSVVMDVVYNHVQSAGDFSVNQLVPGYFTRINDNGQYSNGSGCGNDTASERSMVRKFIVDSVNYWADEYHIDGFRFDLVGLLDTDTVNEIVETVHQNHPGVIFYGEGWTMSTDVTKAGVTLATQVNSAQTPGFAYFSDNIRDALKGSVFDHNPGFVSGASGMEIAIRQAFMGIAPWCVSPAQSVNYASCHDNNTLIDRIALSVPDASRADMIRMNNLAAAVYLTAEGISFMQAGEEMLRTKVNADGTFNENSYSAPDAVNSLKWNTLEEDEYRQVFEYYKGLIAFRKAHAALRLGNPEDVQQSVHPVDGLPANVVAFQVDGGVNGETAGSIFVIFNAAAEVQEIDLPEGAWDVCVDGGHAGTEALRTIEGKAAVEPISAMVLVQNPAAE